MTKPKWKSSSTSSKSPFSSAFLSAFIVLLIGSALAASSPPARFTVQAARSPENAKIGQSKPSVAKSGSNAPQTILGGQNDPFRGYPLLERACSCESWGTPGKYPRQFDQSGNLLTGYPNPNDKGACQINMPTWGKKAASMGLNVEGSFSDNVAMAKYILSVQGIGAWKASESCWKPK